jgi:medium-chain acyl-[acyl-carrier-protein] hydrolase
VKKVWIESFQPNPQASLRLFCFPYAGGAAALYRLWPRALPSFVEVCAVELPGRGRRFGEPLFKSLDALLPALAEGILPFLDKPFAFFGHSMGGLIAFELTRFLRRKKNLQPERLFISAYGAPQNSSLRQNLVHRLSDDEFLKELKRLKGTPREVLEHAELIQLFLPTIRADLELLETYVYIEAFSLEIPIFAFGGLEDPEVSREALDAWRHQTRSSFSLQMLPGDHFFLNTMREELLGVISREMATLSILLFDKR